MKNKNGDWVWILNRGKIVSWDDKGKPKRMTGTNIDITKRKRDEGKLKAKNIELRDTKKQLTKTIKLSEESERNYTKLFNSSRDGYVISRGSGEIFSANPAFANMLGYTLHETLSISWKDLTLDNWLQWELEKHGTDLINRGFTDLYEKESIRKDGTLFSIEIQTFLLNNPENLEYVQIAAFIRDITERKQAEKSLLDSENHLRESQHAARIGSFESTFKDEEMFWSHELYKIFGLNSEEFIPSNEVFSKLLHPDDKEDYLNALMDPLQKGTQFKNEFRAKHKDGKWRYYETNENVKIDAGEVIGLQGTVQDINDQKQAELHYRNGSRLYVQLGILAGAR